MASLWDTTLLWASPLLHTTYYYRASPTPVTPVPEPILLHSMLSLAPGVDSIPRRLYGNVSKSVHIENLSVQRVVLDSIGDGMCCGYGDNSIALYTTVDDSDVLITLSNASFGAS